MLWVEQDLCDPELLDRLIPYLLASVPGHGDPVPEAGRVGRVQTGTE